MQICNFEFVMFFVLGKVVQALNLDHEEGIYTGPTPLKGSFPIIIQAKAFDIIYFYLLLLI